MPGNFRLPSTNGLINHHLQIDCCREFIVLILQESTDSRELQRLTAIPTNNRYQISRGDPEPRDGEIPS